MPLTLPTSLDVLDDFPFECRPPVVPFHQVGGLPDSWVSVSRGVVTLANEVSPLVFPCSDHLSPSFLPTAINVLELVGVDPSLQHFFILFVGYRPRPCPNMLREDDDVPVVPFPLVVIWPS